MPRSRIVEVAGFLALAIASVVAAAVARQAAPGGLTGRYWDRAAADGPATSVRAGRVPSAEDVASQLPPHQVPSGMVEWRGALFVEVGGTHGFSLQSGPGGTVSIGGVTVAGIAPDGLPAAGNGQIDLKAGAHEIRITHVQTPGGPPFDLRWTPPRRHPRPIGLDDVAPTVEAARRRHVPWVRVGLQAVPVVWALLLLYVPVRFASWLAWREVARWAPQRRDRMPLVAVLAGAAILLAWALPAGVFGDHWTVDEMEPDWVRDVMLRGFGNGWYDRYPLLHYVVLSIPISPFELAHRLTLAPVDTLTGYGLQTILVRVVSLLMGLGCLVTAYLCAAEMFGGRRAVLASLALLLTPLFVFYGKMANLDVPSLFWFGWALLAFLRVARHHRMRDYVLLGVAAAAAVATKDQQYANLALLPLGVLALNASRQPSPTILGRLSHALDDSRVWAGAVSALVASAIFHNMLFNFSGFVQHVAMLSAIGQILPMTPPSIAGYLELTWRTAELFRFGSGWPLAVLALGGIVRAAIRPDRRWWLWLLLVPLSFHLTFTLVTRYVCDRYLFGGVFVFALFAGATVADLLDSRWTRTGRAVAVVAFGWSLLYAASVNVMLARDSRHDVRRWIDANVPEGTPVGLLGSTYYMPHLGPPALPVVVRADAGGLASINPPFLVVNDRYARRHETRPEGISLLRGLRDGSLGYREVFRYRAPMPAWALLQYEAPFRGERESDLTNLDKMNPEMVIYRREP